MERIAQMSSLAPVQSSAEYQPWTASTRLREIEITQPDELATRFHLRVPSALAIYMTSWDATRFDQYYNERLYAYIKEREQALAQKNGKHGSFPVSLARISKLVFMLSPLVYQASDWPTVPMGKEVFTPIVDVKQFSGEWTLEDGYAANPGVPSYSAPVNGGGTPNQLDPNYSATIQLETPCDITFFQLKTDPTVDFDQALERIVEEWPNVENQGIVSSLGAARIANVFMVITDAKETDRLDEEVEGTLSQYFNPVIAELFPYPRKSR